MIDRIEDGSHAVLLLEDEGFQIVVPVEELPNGAEEGDWLHVVISAQRLISAEIDPQATRRAQDSVRGKLNRLRQRGRKPRR